MVYQALTIRWESADPDPPASASASASAFARHIEGPIVAIDRAARTFTVRDRERGNGLSTVRVTPSTRFD
ncbi:MAG: hypothetical protein ACXVSL_19640, partial [Solirubrobacteraceae bacterium]